MDRLFFQLFITTVTGKALSVQAEPSDTIDTVKHKLRSQRGEALDDQYLAYAGKQLEGGRTLADYGIGQGCTLELSSRLLGGCYYCHDLGNHPGADPHRSERCRSPRNTHSKYSHRPQTARGGGGGGGVRAKPQCKYGSACYRKNPEHLAKYDHSCPIQAHAGKEWTMYHGTPVSNAVRIKAGGVHGLQPAPSSGNMLGAGVYCSRDLSKAMVYAKKNPSEGGVIFQLRVKPGRVKAIRSIPHPLMQTWHSQGYDTAWVPTGVTPSGREEDCVWDPRRVRIVGVAWSDCGFTW
jgi:hypothetical protein